MYRSLIFILTFLLISAPALVVGEVYKWVDDNGVVQFSDRPGKQGAEKIKIKNVTSSSSIPEARKAKQKKLTSALEQEREIKKKQKERLKQQKEERVKNCKIVKQRLKSYTNAPYLYSEDAKGKKRTLSDDEKEKAIETTKKEIKQWCGKKG